MNINIETSTEVPKIQLEVLNVFNELTFEFAFRRHGRSVQLFRVLWVRKAKKEAALKGPCCRLSCCQWFLRSLRMVSLYCWLCQYCSSILLLTCPVTHWLLQAGQLDSATALCSSVFTYSFIMELASSRPLKNVAAARKKQYIRHRVKTQRLMQISNRSLSSNTNFYLFPFPRGLSTSNTIFMPVWIYNTGREMK